MAKLKLKGRNSHKKTIILIVCIALVLVIGVVTAVLLLQNKKQGEQISHINVSSMPNDVEYFLEEEFDKTGLTVQVILNNGSHYFVSADKVTVTGFDSSKVNDNLQLKVSYQGFSDYFKVKIKEFPKPAPTLVAIEVKDISKTTYTMAEWNSSWLIINDAYIECQYSDGSTYRVTLTYHHIDGLGDIKSPGTYELTVKYDENGVLCSTPLEITITE